MQVHACCDLSAAPQADDPWLGEKVRCCSFTQSTENSAAHVQMSGEKEEEKPKKLMEEKLERKTLIKLKKCEARQEQEKALY